MINHSLGMVLFSVQKTPVNFGYSWKYKWFRSFLTKTGHMAFCSSYMCKMNWEALVICLDSAASFRLYCLLPILTLFYSLFFNMGDCLWLGPLLESLQESETSAVIKSFVQTLVSTVKLTRSFRDRVTIFSNTSMAKLSDILIFSITILSVCVCTLQACKDVFPRPQADELGLWFHNSLVCSNMAAPRFWKWGGDNFVSGASK